MKITPLLAPLALVPLAGCIIHVDGDGWDYGNRNEWTRAESHGLRGDGLAASDERAVGEFDALEVSGAFRVSVEVGGGEAAVVVSGDRNLLEHVRTRVVDGTLEVSTERALRPRRDLVLDVRVPDLRSIDLSGANRAEITGLDRDAFAVHASGGSVLRAAGRVAALELRADGASELDCSGLEATDVLLETSGSSRADILVRGTLDVDVSGSSQVTYGGGGRLRVLDVSGSVQLTEREDG